MATPSSQKADERPIAFKLIDAQGGTTTVPLVLRPEDLTRDEATLMAPQQTFDGAFIDDFGPGLSNIQISGHTGWRGGATEDGAAHFKNLYRTVWREWHAQRLQAVQDGKDRDAVKLIFADALDDITVVVAPGRFILKRSRSRPLLTMYQINMTVLSDQITDKETDPLSVAEGSIGPNSIKAGVASLTSTVAKLKSATGRVNAFIQGVAADPVKGLLNVSTQSMDKVLGVVDGTRGVIGGEAAQAIGIARDLSQVGRNVMNTYAAVATMPDFIRHEVGAVAGSFENAFCVLSNVFNPGREYPVYDGLYGSSSCSSTVGGAPLSAYDGLNPWEYVLPSQVNASLVTPDARANIDFMKAADPILRPMGLADLASRVSSIASGVRILG